MKFNMVMICTLIILVFLGCNEDNFYRSTITYYNNKNVRNITSYKINLLPSGEKEITFFFINYYKTGKLESIYSQLNKYLQGPYLKFDNDGILIEYEMYLKGRLNGNCFKLFKNGKIKSSSVYKAGQLKKEMTYDSTNGYLLTDVLYNNGEVVQILRFNKKRLVKKKINFRQSSGELFCEYTEFYTDGKIKQYIRSSENPSNYYYENNYDSLTGKSKETKRFFHYNFYLTGDSAVIEPIIDYRFDVIKNYSINIKNTTEKNNITLIDNRNNRFVLKYAKNLSWIYEICDSIGCGSMPITFIDED